MRLGTLLLLGSMAFAAPFGCGDDSKDNLPCSCSCQCTDSSSYDYKAETDTACTTECDSRCGGMSNVSASGSTCVTVN